MFKQRETLFIIFTHKIHDQSAPEVEFSSDSVTTKVTVTVENEYTMSVAAPGTYLQDVLCSF